MNNGIEQLVDYIRQQLQQGVPKESVFQALIQSGWDETRINQAFFYLQNPSPYPDVHQQTSSASKSAKSGILWILSPFIVLFSTVFISAIVRFADINSPFMNVITILLGFAGVILIFVGPVVGIVKLARK